MEVSENRGAGLQGPLCTREHLEVQFVVLSGSTKDDLSTSNLHHIVPHH